MHMFFQTIEEWRIVFVISAAVYLFGCLVYWFWASGEVQPWAKTDANDEKPKSNELGTPTYVGYSNQAVEMDEWWLLIAVNKNFPLIKIKTPYFFFFNFLLLFLWKAFRSHPYFTYNLLLCLADMLRLCNIF